MRRLVIATALVFAGCVAPQKPPELPPVARMAFPEAEYQSIPDKRAKGECELRGQAFLRTRGGDVKKGAGSLVFLNPVTGYSREWWTYGYTLRQPLSPADPRLENYVRETQADADGRFTFRDVPRGDYFVVSSVSWDVPRMSYDPIWRTTTHTMEQQGGLIAARVRLCDQQPTEVILTR